MSLFRRKPKPDPLIRWYGKLPVYGDYYDSGSGGDWVAEFTQKWLMKGLELYEQRRRNDANANPAPGHEHRPAHRLPTGGCILQLPQSGMTVIASCLDFGGDIVGRRFPLCFFVGLPAADWPGMGGGSAIPAIQALSELLRLGKQVARFLNEPGLKGPEQFRAQFADHEVNLDGLAVPLNGWMEKAGSIRMADWYSATSETLGADDLDAWLLRTARWGNRITRTDGPAFKSILSLPLAPEQGPHPSRIDRGVQVAGWFRWLENRMDLKARPLSLILADEQAPPRSRMTVIVGELAPEDFLLLTPLAAELKHVDDLSMVRDEPAGNDSHATDASGQADAAQADASSPAPPSDAPAAATREETASQTVAIAAAKLADHGVSKRAVVTWADFVNPGSQVALKV